MKSLSIKSLLAVVLLLLVLGFVAGQCLAVQDIEDVNTALDQQAAPEPEDDYLLIGLLKLIGVLIVIVLAVWLIIRLFGKKIRSRLQGNWLRIVDEVSLGQNRGIVLCEISGKIYALGVTDHQINLLFDLEDPELLADIELASMDAGEHPEGFQADWLATINQWLGLLGGKRGRPGREPRNFHRLVQEQNQRMKDIYEQEVHNERNTDDRRNRS